MTYKWMNNYTGEIFPTLYKAITTAIHDIIKYKTCRTIQIFNIKRNAQRSFFARPIVKKITLINFKKRVDSLPKV